MKKCKDCKLYKNGCGFSSVDEQLGLDGNFVACGQFVKKEDIEDIERNPDKINEVNYRKRY